MAEKDYEQLDIDFIGIGTAKSATTWIYGCLSEHPDIFMSEIKESHMFRKKYYDLKNIYQQCFRSAKPGQIKGEFTPGNMISPAAAERIHRHAPNAKLIACLRDPIDRTTSMYNYSLVSGKPSVDFTRLVRDYKTSNEYFKQLVPYLEKFPRENILILIYEDIEKDPKSFIKNIYSFLGVDDTFVPSLVVKKTNITSANSTVFPLVHKILLTMRYKIKHGPRGRQVAKFMRKIGINKIVSSILRKNTRPESKLIKLEKKEMPEELKNEMRSFLKDDIHSLEGLLGRQLIEWQTRS